MKPTLLRILGHGLLTAAALAVAGYGLAEFAGVYLAAQPGGEKGGAEWAGEITATLRRRLPAGMAAWGFGLVAVFELLLRFVRGEPVALPAKPVAPDPAEALWNGLLRYSEAAPACPPGPPAENTPAPPAPPSPDGPPP